MLAAGSMSPFIMVLSHFANAATLHISLSGFLVPKVHHKAPQVDARYLLPHSHFSEQEIASLTVRPLR